MDKSVTQLKLLIGNVVSEFNYVDESKMGVWIKEGDYLKSKIEIELENEQIDYELYIYLKKEKDEPLTPHEMFVILHELAHLLILEKMRKEKGIKTVEKYLEAYNEDVLLLNQKAKSENWHSKKIQSEYEKIEFEKETDFTAKILFTRYIHIASF